MLVLTIIESSLLEFSFNIGWIVFRDCLTLFFAYLELLIIILLLISLGSMWMKGLYKQNFKKHRDLGYQVSITYTCF